MHKVVNNTAFFKWKPAAFNFFALSIGAIIPDLECPFMYLFTWDRWKARLVMHSLLGSVTVDLLLAVALTVWAVPPFLRWLDGAVAGASSASAAGWDRAVRAANKH